MSDKRTLGESLSESLRLSTIKDLKALIKSKKTPQPGLSPIVKYLDKGHVQAGQPKGSKKSTGDEERFRRMDLLLTIGEAKSVNDAARKVADEMPESTITKERLIRRLRDGFKSFRELRQPVSLLR